MECYWKDYVELICVVKESTITSLIPMVKVEEKLAEDNNSLSHDIKGKVLTLSQMLVTFLQMAHAM